MTTTVAKAELTALELDAIAGTVSRLRATSCVIQIADAALPTRTVSVSVPAEIDAIRGLFTISITSPEP